MAVRFDACQLLTSGSLCDDDRSSRVSTPVDRRGLLLLDQHGRRPVGNEARHLTPINRAISAGVTGRRRIFRFRRRHLVADGRRWVGRRRLVMSERTPEPSAAVELRLRVTRLPAADQSLAQRHHRTWCQSPNNTINYACTQVSYHLSSVKLESRLNLRFELKALFTLWW